MAREKLPAESQIWIAAARLEEANGNPGIVEKILSKGLKSLRAHQVAIDREAWLKLAENAETLSLRGTCIYIIGMLSNTSIGRSAI